MPAAEAGADPTPGHFRLRRVEPLGARVTRYEVEAPLVARKRQAGHFVIVRVTRDGERIPLTVVDADPAAGTITLVVQAIGATTKAMARLRAGDRLADVLGPLGNPTHIERYGSVACVGGGVGTAELLPIGRALRAAGNAVHTVLGARTRDLVILEAEMAAISDTLAVTTDDGTYGEHGVVTAPLSRRLAAGAVSAVYAIGPLPMMRAVADVTRPFGVKTWVSLNALMVDGTGMCGGCRVTVGGRMRFACVDGPEFDGHEVDYDELIRRSRTYAEFERLADARAEAAREVRA
jgi:ferredoxin--NADP+ reductase